MYLRQNANLKTALRCAKLQMRPGGILYHVFVKCFKIGNNISWITCTQVYWHHCNCMRMPSCLQRSCLATIRPTGLSARGSCFLMRKNGADQPRLNSVAQLGGPLPRVENGNKY